MDEKTDSCLGSYGFGDCSETNIWNWTQTERGITLQPFNQDNEESENACLGRSWRGNGLKLRSCQRKAPWPSNIYWRYDALTGRLISHGGMGKLLGESCIVHGSSRLLADCNYHYTPLMVVPFEGERMNADEEELLLEETILSKLQKEKGNGNAQEEYLLEEGEWECEKSGQHLPRNLDAYLPLNQHNRQVLMGAGLFTKNVFGMTWNVYDLGWYVDIEAARIDPALASFHGLSSAELQRNEDFLQMMASSTVSFDRSLVIKLAMTLPKDVIVQGLVEELLLAPNHKDILAEATKRYDAAECPAGMQILFTWKQGIKDAHGEISELFEVRIDQNLIVSLSDEGLASDFFFQYFRDDPVAPEARRQLVRNFPLLWSQPANKSGDSIIRHTTSTKAKDGWWPRWQHVILPQDRAIQLQFHRLLLKRYRTWVEECILSAMVVCYVLLLILASLPPMKWVQKKVVSSVAYRAKQVAKLKKDIQQKITKTLSRSSSLMKLVQQPASTDLEVL
eukprot:scaffold39_cov176-Ochromonas_danica.AAC.3